MVLGNHFCRISDLGWFGLIESEWISFKEISQGPRKIYFWIEKQAIKRKITNVKQKIRSFKRKIVVLSEKIMALKRKITHLERNIRILSENQ